MNPTFSLQCYDSFVTFIGVIRPFSSFHCRNAFYDKHHLGWTETVATVKALNEVRLEVEKDKHFLLSL
jgi:hypothetical protein